MTARPLSSDEVGQVVLVHQIPLPCATVFCCLACVLFLVLGQDQVRAPVVPASTLHVSLSAIGGAMHWLRDAVDVAALVVLKVLFQVQPHVARCVGRAAGPRQGGLAALGAELALHLSCPVEAAVAAQDPSLQLLDARHV